MNASDNSPDPVIQIGTSGYSYTDWVGHFYPKGMKKEQFLTHYAEHFSTVEINYTYYRMPTAKTFEAMIENSKSRVRFAVKLHGDMTHKKTAGQKEFKDFISACLPLSKRDRLGPFLAQFPYSFHANEKNADYLRKLREYLPGKDVVVELRNAKWVKQSTFELLKELDFGYCCVDEPQIKGLLPPLAVATSKTGYVRFHGRNAARWYQHERPEERYDYRYSKDELSQWVPRIKKLASLCNKVYCFTNNHYQSKAVESAQLLMELLESS